MKKRKPFLRWAGLLVLSLLVGVRIYSWIALNLGGNATPMPFGTGASVVLSGSMEPSISVGDLLIYRETDDYSPGDVVVYQVGTTPVVHRIVALDDTTVTTRGDANDSDDAPFAREMLKGRVVAQIPWVGNVILFLKTPIGTLIVAAAAVILLEMSYKKEREEKKQNRAALEAEIQRLKQEMEQP